MCVCVCVCVCVKCLLHPMLPAKVHDNIVTLNQDILPGKSRVGQQPHSRERESRGRWVLHWGLSNPAMLCHYSTRPHTRKQGQTHMATHPCLYSISRMNIDSVASFLEDQSKLYQSHCSKKERIQTVLNFQHNIRNYKTIPKQYMPSNFHEIPTGNQSLSTDFHQEYSTLFSSI